MIILYIVLWYIGAWFTAWLEGKILPNEDKAPQLITLFIWPVMIPLMFVYRELYVESSSIFPRIKK
jgi:hypothetical protein